MNKKGKIFIGRGERITEQFARKNQKVIIDISKSLSINLCKTYQSKQHIEDYAQDTMLYIIENCGYLEKNFNQDFKLCRGLIYIREKAFIKGIIIKGKKSKTISIDSFYKDRKDNSLNIKDRKENVECEALDNVEKVEDSEELIKKVLVYVENGENPIEAIKQIAKINGIDFQKLIEQFKTYYIETKNINISKVGLEK